MANHNEEPSYLKLLLDDSDEGESDEEALSLSDLPVQLEQSDHPLGEVEANSTYDSESESESEFEFGSWLGSVSTQPFPDMCAADDLFFQGRILPLRRHDSVAHSSEKKSLDNRGPVLRSDSMDSGSISRVTSTSSRSSSKGSQHSSSYSMTSTSTSFGSSRVRYSSVSNQFCSCPSPSPQTGFHGNSKPALLQGTTKIRSKSQRNLYSSSSSSSMWEFFRTGLVRTPDMELHNLKTRSKNNNNICDNSNWEEQGGKKKKKKKGMGFGLLGGCKCTADSVATNLVLLRSDSRRLRGRRKCNVGSVEEEELRRKLMELIEIDETRTMKAKKKKMKKKDKEKEEEPEVVEKFHRDGRTSRSHSRHRRTFEWVKELPLAGGYYVLHQY